MGVFKRVVTVAAGLALAVGSLFVPQAEAQVDVYVTEGTFTINGRQWRTECEPYSATERCRTEIWGTTVSVERGRFVQKNDWQFNNLTYKASPRALWKGNLVGGNGEVGFNKEWTAQDGRKWRTECDTATTGRGGCRAYVEASVIAKTASGFQWRTQWVLNNMVRFTPGSSTPAAPKTVAETIARIPDDGLRACLTRQMARQVDVTVSGPKAPWSLSCRDDRDPSVKSLAGLEAFPTLVALDVWWNDLTDLSTLPQLPQLKILDVSHNDLTSLKGIEKAPNLTVLVAESNLISDLSPLAKLTKLEELWVFDNRFADLRPLSGLTALSVASIGANPFTSIAPVAKLPLTELDIPQAPVADYSVLSGMKTLTYLGLWYSAFSDASILSGLTLEELDLSSTKVTKVAPLAGMTTLKELDLTDTQVTDRASLDALVAAGLVIIP